MLKAIETHERALNLSMFKKALFFLFLFLPLLSWSQGALTGNVFDDKERTLAIEGVTIKNLSSKALAFSDKDGHFVLVAKAGDLVSFNMPGYHIDTLYLINLLPKNIYLRENVNELDVVNITTVKLSPFLNFKDPEAAPARAVDYGKERGGVRFSLGYGKYKREQEKIAALTEYDKVREEISKKFTADYVKELVKFKGEGLKDFINMFRPTVEQVKAQQPFNYDFYTTKAYHTWLKLPPNARKLPSPPKDGAN